MCSHAPLPRAVSEAPLHDVHLSCLESLGCKGCCAAQSATKLTESLTEAAAAARAGVELRTPDQALLAGLDPKQPATLAKALDDEALMAHVEELLAAWRTSVEAALGQPDQAHLPAAEVGPPFCLPSARVASALQHRLLMLRVDLLVAGLDIAIFLHLATSTHWVSADQHFEEHQPVPPQQCACLQCARALS